MHVGIPQNVQFQQKLSQKQNAELQKYSSNIIPEHYGLLH